MPQILYPPARPQTVGEVLKASVQIFRLTLNASLPYSIVVAICTQLANLRNLSMDLPVPSPLQSDQIGDPAYLAWYVVGTILALLFWSAMLLRQKALASGERSGATAELRQSGIQLSSLIVCMILSTVAVTVGLLPVAAALPMTGLNPALTNLAAANVPMLLLLIPLSLPAAWLSLGLLFAPPALVLKKLGPIEAMRVSFALLRGNWWRTSVLTTVLAAVLLAMVLVVGAIAAAVVGAAGVSDVRFINSLAIPLGIIFGAIMLPWCGAQVLAMMGDLIVRQNEARRAAGPGPTA